MVEGVAPLLAGRPGDDLAIWDDGDDSADRLEDQPMVVLLLLQDFGREMLSLVMICALVVCVVSLFLWILFWLRGDD